MPIKWSAVKVNDAMDMAEEFVNQVAEPLEQAKIVAREAKKMANLPQYIDQGLNRLIGQIERMDNVRGAIKSVRASIPDGAMEAERNILKHGTTQSLM